MATDITTASDAAKIAFMADGVEVAERDNVFGAITGGADAPVYRVTGLEGKRSGYVKKGIHIYAQNPTAGSSGWNATEVDKEEDIVPTLEDLELTNYVKGFDLGPPAQEQYNILDFNRDYKILVARWIADIIEGGQTGFTGLTDQMLSSPTTRFYGAIGNGTTNVAGLVAGEHLTVDKLTEISAALKAGVAQDGSTEFLKFRKANFLGYSRKFAMIANPITYRTLKQTSDWKTIQQNAQRRGTDNILFQGLFEQFVIGEWDGIVLLESDRVPLFAAGETVDASVAAVAGGRCIIMGAQSALYGTGMNQPFVIGYNRDKTKRYAYHKLIKGSKATAPGSTTFGSATLDVALAAS
jgi:hypothetical protein